MDTITKRVRLELKATVEGIDYGLAISAKPEKLDRAFDMLKLALMRAIDHDHDDTNKCKKKDE